MKNILIVIILMSFSAFSYADQWPDKDCKEYSGYIGFLVAVSGTSMEEASEAMETGDKVKAEEKFIASHILAEQAANHTKVFNTFCK